MIFYINISRLSTNIIIKICEKYLNKKSKTRRVLQSLFKQNCKNQLICGHVAVPADSFFDLFRMPPVTPRFPRRVRLR